MNIRWPIVVVAMLCGLLAVGASACKREEPKSLAAQILTGGLPGAS